MTVIIKPISSFMVIFLLISILQIVSRPAYAQHALMEAYTQAVRNGNLNEAKSYFDMGISIDYVNEDDGKTPLLIACCRSDSAKNLICDLPMIKMLVENGANVNAATPDGRSALMLLCEVNSQETQALDAVKYFIAHGTNTNLTDHRKRTVLSYACCTIYHSCNFLLIKYLLEIGTKPNTTDKSKQTPMIWLAQCKKEYEKDCILSAKELIIKGADKNVHDLQGKSAKQIALKHGLKKLAQIL